MVMVMKKMSSYADLKGLIYWYLSVHGLKPFGSLSNVNVQRLA